MKLEYNIKRGVTVDFSKSTEARESEKIHSIVNSYHNVLCIYAKRRVQDHKFRACVDRLYCHPCVKIQHLGFARFQLCNSTIRDARISWCHNNKTDLMVLSKTHSPCTNSLQECIPPL